MSIEYLTYSLVDATAVEGSHGSFCSSWIVVLNKTVVETFALYRKQKSARKKLRSRLRRDARMEV